MASKITATVITYNEEAHIGACLDSLAGVADEIVVIDSFSTDSTVDICRRRGCKITQRHLAGYGAQRQYATSMASYPYILSIDADEELSPALARNLMAMKAEGFTHRVYAFSRLNFFCGKPIRHCGWYPDTQIRLFDKRYANWNLRDVAESVIFRDSVRPQPVDGDILHYRCTTPEEYSLTMTHQADLRSRVLAATAGSSIGPLTPVLKAMGAWWSTWVRRGGWLDGKEGRIIAGEEFRRTRRAYSGARLLSRHHDDNL